MNVKTKAACELSADYHLYVLLSPHSYCQKDQDYPKKPILSFSWTEIQHVNAHEKVGDEKSRGMKTKGVTPKFAEGLPRISQHRTSPTTRLKTAENSQSESSTDKSPA